MILCVDVGNTSIFFGFVSDGEVLSSFRIPTYCDDYWSLLENRLMGEKPRRVVISSVVPSVDVTLSEVLSCLTGQNPLFVKRDYDVPFEVAIEKPETLGADRIADAYGAMRQYALPLLIVDMGTATTISVIDERGVFLGGTIGPGVMTSWEALTHKAAQLKEYKLEIPDRVIGHSTQSCINSGIIMGHAAMIDGMVSRIEAETRKRYNIVVTGGMADQIAQLCNRDVIVDTLLILKGIYYLAVRQ